MAKLFELIKGIFIIPRDEKELALIKADREKMKKMKERRKQKN